MLTVEVSLVSTMVTFTGASSFPPDLISRSPVRMTWTPGARVATPPDPTVIPPQ
jgi:hypothetical protein